MTERINLSSVYRMVKALEERVAKLETPLPMIQGRNEYDATDYVNVTVPITGPFTVESRGPRWYCVSPDGVKVNERGLTHEEALKLADEMNGVTKEMSPA